MIKIVKDKDKTSVVLAGDIGVQDAEELHQKLISAFKESREVIINFRDTTGINILCLQLIWAADLTANKSDKKIKFSIKKADYFRELIKNSGFVSYFFPESSKDVETLQHDSSGKRG
ncbi:MAG: hypothetical protein KAR07_05525 [Spirochaetes bacterium]|nr:hypothetical protein [Spirochaetota bacterium]